MQLKKIVPLALAAVMTTTTAAGAANLSQETETRASRAYTYVYESGFRQNLLEKYFAFLCGQYPGNRPEQKPEETPDIEQPEETPDIEQPEETPDIEQPEETPDIEQPEEGPEQTPDNAPQLPDDNRPEQTPDTTPEEDNGSSQGDYASQVVALVNAERAKYGLSALKVDSRVQQAAQDVYKRQLPHFLDKCGEKFRVSELFEAVNASACNAVRSLDGNRWFPSKK